MGLGTVSDAGCNRDFARGGPGICGSKVTEPETPLALPLTASSGASRLNVITLTPLGSLKSKVSRAAAFRTGSASADKQYGNGLKFHSFDNLTRDICIFD